MLLSRTDQLTTITITIGIPNQEYQTTTSTTSTTEDHLLTSEVMVVTEEVYQMVVA